ncbi:MAG: HNH endonuclease [Lachnospiraceae bacterium]|nr:HNH endonuclease [Lachnospiraceae bacterium]
MKRKLWTREEEIVVFNLYCKIPFNKSSKFHPEVIRIANLIGRTPSAVNMKIGNFGRFDEKLKKNNITGLTNGSKLDEDIWNEFNEKWDTLAYESEMILQSLEQGKDLDTSIKVYGTDIERKVKVRVNQKFFRTAVLASYGGCCCITGLSTEALLIASHIKPWHTCSNDEKTNPHNGLCLNALHDRAFDKGFMTIGTDYKVHVSKDITDVFKGEIVDRYFYSYEGNTIILPEKFSPNKEFLEYHNDMIFENWKRG